MSSNRPKPTARVADAADSLPLPGTRTLSRAPSGSAAWSAPAHAIALLTLAYRAALDEADASARRREDERTKQFAALEWTVREGERAVDEREQEIRERYRWKWWLMLPLIRLGLMKLPRVRK